MRLRPGLALFPLDDGVVVFSEDFQSLFGLNASAAFVARRLDRGIPAADIAKSLIAEGLSPPGEAERWVTTALESLAAHGLLADGQAPAPVPMGTLARDPPPGRGVLMPPLEGFKPVAERRYRLLHTRTLIRFGIDGQRHMVDTVIGHLGTDDDAPPDFVLDIEAVRRSAPSQFGNDRYQFRSNIYRDGTWIETAHRLSWLGPVVKALLWQAAIKANDYLFCIHAGVVGTGEGCVILPATAGSGKSSLTAALTHRGFRYFSDEVALLQRTSFLVPPLPLALCVKDTGWDVMARYYPELPTRPIHRRRDGKVVRYVAPPSGAGQDPPTPVSHIVFPRYRADASTDLAPVPRVEAVGRLLNECLAMRQRLDQDIIARVVRWMSGIECYALTFSSLEEAARLIAEVTGPAK